MFPSDLLVKGWQMSDFKNTRVTFSILKVQKCDAYQNGVEFCHEANDNDVKWPPLLFFLPPPLLLSICIYSILLADRKCNCWRLGCFFQNTQNQVGDVYLFAFETTDQNLYRCDKKSFQFLVSLNLIAYLTDGTFS